MGRFDSQQLLAKRLISLNGEDAVITNQSTQDVVDKPWLNGPAVPTPINCKAVFFNYTTQDAGKRYEDGTEIHLDDKKVLVAAHGLSAVPDIQSTITRADGTVYRVMKVKLLDPNGQKILFEFQVRK